VSFISDYVWLSDVTEALHAMYGGEARRAPPPAPSPCTAVRVKRIADARHPACGEFGLFARTDLVQGQHILDYLGLVSVAEDRASDYVVDFGEHSELALDALAVGNEARFINDFRNTGQHANVEFRLRRGERGELRQGVYVGAGVKYVRAGTELLISYGKNYWKSRVGADLESFIYRKPGK